MASTLFDLECDRLIRVAHPEHHEQRQWQRNEGALLAALFDRIRGFFAHRTDFFVQQIETEERNVIASIGPSDVIDDRYFQLILETKGANVIVRGSSGQNYSFLHDQIHEAPIGDLSDEWLEKVLRAAMANVELRDDPTATELAQKPLEIE